MHRSPWALVALMFFLASGIRGEERSAIASMARILSEFMHTCTPAQCEMLRSIVAEDTTTIPERALASALLRVDHVPDPNDMAQLRALALDSSQTSDVRTVARVLYRLVHAPTDEDRAVLAAVSRHQYLD